MRFSNGLVKPPPYSYNGKDAIATSRIMVGGSKRRHNLDRILVLDGYSTPKIATTKLMENVELAPRIWEPANGYGAISLPLKERNHKVFTSDVYRWHKSTMEVQDFFDYKKAPAKHDIITNPPFKLAFEFAQHGIKIIDSGYKIGLLVRLQFLESIRRKKFFQNHPPRCYVFSKRLPFLARFDDKKPIHSSAMAFAWFVWTKDEELRNGEIYWL